MEATLHTPATIYSRRHVPSWLLLAGAAGAVNGFVFMLCAQFVTHVTGTVTRLGLEWPHAGIAAEYAAVGLSFVAGAGASVAAIQARARRGKPPRWALPLVCVAALLTGVAAAGVGGAFGPFGIASGGVAADAPPPFALLSLLAFAMGLQNATVSTATGSAVRTTHLTGPSSDLGVFLGTAWISAGDERLKAVRAAALRAGKVAAFVVGAGLAVGLAPAMEYLMLLVPAAFVLLAAALSFTYYRTPHRYLLVINKVFARPTRAGA